MSDQPARIRQGREPQTASARQEREPLKMVNHSRKIFGLFKPAAQWFNDHVRGSGPNGLCLTGTTTISTGMQGAFVERWHKETSSFRSECVTTCGPHVRFTTLKIYFEF